MTNLDHQEKGMIKENPNLITLKEAAEMSGYSSDYIGQLIRSGKLPGQQVFANVAWMTTREAVLEYTQKGRRSSVGSTGSLFEKMFSIERLVAIFGVFTKAVIGLMAVFLLFLGYVLSVSIDHHIEKQYQEKLEHAQSI
jgi:hypothetical protein